MSVVVVPEPEDAIASELARTVQVNPVSDSGATCSPAASLDIGLGLNGECAARVAAVDSKSVEKCAICQRVDHQ